MLTGCLSSRETRTTAPPGSAAPPAPAPPGRSALGATPRPHGRPSTTAGQVLGPTAPVALREAGFLAAFPARNQPLACSGRARVAVGDGEPVHEEEAPWCPGGRVPARPPVRLWVEERAGPALGAPVSVEQTQETRSPRRKEPVSAQAEGARQLPARVGLGGGRGVGAQKAVPLAGPRSWRWPQEQQPRGKRAGGPHPAPPRPCLVPSSDRGP